MKDVIIKIDQNSMVYKQETVLGISYENLQGKIIFKFLGTFPKGTAYLEYERDTEKGYLQMNQVGEEYQLEIKSSLLTKEGRIYLQLRVTEDATPEGTPVFKSNKFYLEVKEAINATAEIPDEYPEWIDTANEKIKEMDNLNITTERVEDGVNIVLTDKKGVTTRTEVKDGAPGPVGPQGAPGAVKMQVVDTLPETGETDTIYLVKKDNPGEQNLYDEYVYTDTGWEHIGDTSVDLSDYYTKTETTKLIDSSLKKYYLTTSLPMSKWNGISYTLGNVEQTSIHDILKDSYDNNRKSFEIILINSSKDYNTPKTMILYCNKDVTQKPTSITIYSDILGGTNGILLNQSSLTSKFFSVSISIYLSWNGDDFTFKPGSGITCSSFEILRKDNLYPYTPTGDYNPATKKYVDDQVGNINTVLATLTTVSEVSK